MNRKSYDRQFKLSAVKMVIEEGLPVSLVATELSIHPNTLYIWLRDYEGFGDNSFPGKGNPIHNYQFEIRKLQKENEALIEEVTLLKKYQAFLKLKNR